MTSFDISTPALNVAVKGGEAVDVTFVVTSFIAEDVEVQAELTGVEGHTWVTLGGAFPMTFEARGTRQLTARVAPPAGSDAVILTVGLSLYSVRNPNDVGTSPSVQVRVKRARRPFPWWIVVVAAVVLVGAGVGLWLATRSPDPLGLGAACGADIKASCGAPLTCDRGQCRFPVGKGPCAAPGDCVSDACVDQLCAVPRPVLGQTCSPSTGCATDDLTCVAGRCRLITGRSGCTKAEDCVSQGCEGGVCVLPGEGQPCLQGQCGAGLKCFTFQQSAFCVAGEINVDRAGSDYSVTQLSTPNPAECRALCKRDQTCKAWTFVKPGVQGPQARCYLKRPAPGPTNNTCCVSGLEHR